MKNRNKYQNSHTSQFIDGYPEKIVETTEIASLLKFNFTFLDVNQKDAGFIGFEDLDDKNRLMLWEKVKSFSAESRYIDPKHNFYL